MAAALGRGGSVVYNSVALIGIKSATLEFENTKIEITDNDSNGFRQYMTTAGDRSVTISIEGIVKDQVLKDKVAAGTIALDDVTVNMPDGSILVSDIIIDSFSNVLPYNEAVTFSATLVTNGTFTYTP